jgi:hypothetical protein
VSIQVWITLGSGALEEFCPAISMAGRRQLAALIRHSRHLAPVTQTPMHNGRAMKPTNVTIRVGPQRLATLGHPLGRDSRWRARTRLLGHRMYADASSGVAIRASYAALPGYPATPDPQQPFNGQVSLGKTGH